MGFLARETKKQLSRILHACTQRIAGISLIFLVTLLFIGPPLMPTFYWAVVLIFHVFLVTNLVRLALGLVFTSWKTNRYTKTNWIQRYDIFLEKNKQHIGSRYTVKPQDIRHLIIIPK